MRLRKLVKEDDAVSPVIGVILMVAITVILAAVIASFVLGLGDTADEVQPTTSFNFDYDEADGNLTVTLTDGDSIVGENLWIRGEMNSTEDQDQNDINANWEDFAGDDVDEVHWSGGTSGFDGVEVSSGQGIEISGGDDVNGELRDYDISVVWDTGDDSATLESDDREEP